MSNLTPCKFYIKGSDKALSYDEFRQHLLENYDTLVEPKAEVKPSKLSEKANKARELASKYRKAAGGTLSILPNAIATALEVYADILDAVDNIGEAIKRFKSTDEYKALSVEDKAEVDDIISEDEVEAEREEEQKKKVDFEKAKGEERVGSRSRRIEANKAYSDKLNGFSKTYRSVNSNAITGLVNEFYDNHVRGVEGGMDDVIEYAGKLIVEDAEAALKGENPVFTKSAFGVMLLQKVISESQLLGDLDTATRANDVVTSIGRFAGTAVALQQAGISLDALGIYLPQEFKNQQEVLSEKTKSGRTKKEVITELKEESDKARAKAVDEATESEKFDTTVSEPKEVKTSKKQENKKAQLKKRELDAKEKIRRALRMSDSGGGILMAAASPKKALLVEGIIELARVKVEQGAYSFEKVVEKIAKDLKGLVDKSEIESSLLDVWNKELAKIAETERQNEAIERLKDAVEGDSTDKALRALAKALRAVNKEFNGKRLNDKQVLEEILKDPEKSEMLLGQVIGMLSDEVAQGKLLDTIDATRPSGMSDEQWDAFRAKAVMARYKNFINELLGKAKEQSDVKLLEDWQKAKDKHEQALEKKRKQEEIKERERIAKKEFEDAEKAVKEIEKAAKQIEADKEAWLKAKERHEKAIENAKKKYESKEKERLAKEEEKEAERALKEIEKAAKKIEAENEAWIKAKDKRDKKLAELQKIQDEKERAKLSEKELEEREKALKEAEDAWNKATKEAVKNVARKFYKNPNTNQTLAEALIEELPQLTPQQAIELAAKVADQVNKILDANDNRRIKELFHELTDGKEDANISRVITKTLWNRGAVSQFGFVNLLSNFLGYKGVPQHAIAQITTLVQQAAKLPAGQLRQQIITQANTIAASYNETAWSFLLDVMREVMVRNLLSKFKTAFTGGFSMYLSLVPQVGKKILTNSPMSSLRAQKHAWKTFLDHRMGIRQALAESMLKHNDPFALEVGKSDNLFSKERAWQRARKAGWKDVSQMWKANKIKGGALAFGRMLTEATFQGKVPITSIIPDFMAFCNYVGYQYASELNKAYNAQNKLALEGVKVSDPNYKQEFLKQIGLGAVQMQTIEDQIDLEIQQASRLGLPIPKNFRNTRKRQLVNQYANEDISSKAADQAVIDIAMNNPRSLMGATIYNALSKLKLTPKEQGQLNFNGFLVNMFGFDLALFSKQAIVLAERAATMTPIVGAATYLFPYNYEIKNGKVQKIRDENSEIEKWTKDKTEVAYRIAASAAVLAIWAYILTNWWDDEEVKDMNGKPIIDKETGKAVTRKVWQNNGKFDFYGTSKEFTSDERGQDPRGTLRIYNDDGTFSDYPFEMFPAFYGGLMWLGMARDQQRYADEKVVLDIDDKDELVKKLKESASIDWVSAAIGSAVNSGNFDFQTIPRLISESKNKTTGEFTATGIDVLLVSPAKSLVNPAIAQSIEQQIYNINDMHKVYINLSGDVQEMGAALLKDVWFTDPFIPDRENYESVDVFGNKIEYPPIYNDFIGSFGNTSNYAMANHIEKYKSQYEIFKSNDKDKENLPFPKRYNFTPTEKDADTNVKYVAPNEEASKKLKRKIGDEAFVQFDELVNENKKDIMAVPFDKRGAVLDYVYDIAKYKAIKKYFPHTKRAAPKLTSSDFVKYSKTQKDIMEKLNAEALK